LQFSAMASVVLEVFNPDGTRQTVSLSAHVRSREVAQAIARRRGTEQECAIYAVGAWWLRTAKIRRVVRVETSEMPGEEATVTAITAWQQRLRDGSKKLLQEHQVEEEPAEVDAALLLACLTESEIDAFEDLVKSGTVVPGKKAAGSAPTSPRQSAQYSFGKTDKSGYLFQRSAANPREWQRRFCALRRNDLVHCLIALQPEDVKKIALTQCKVKRIPPEKLAGLKYCFEVDTLRDTLQFRAKTEEDASSWVAAISLNIDLALENERFHLAERMIEDGQSQICNREEMVLEAALSSLEGLLSTHAGADRLFRFAKRASLGSKGERNAELVSFFLDLERAHHTFSALLDSKVPNQEVSSPISDRQPSIQRHRSSLRFLQASTASVVSSVSSVTGGIQVNSSTAILSRKEWMSQICERFLLLFHEPEAAVSKCVHNNNSKSSTDVQHSFSDTVLSSSDVSQGEQHKVLSEIICAARSLRQELSNESLQSVPRASCIVVIEEARSYVLQELEQGLYRDFCQSPDYFRIVSSIPSHMRSGRG